MPGTLDGGRICWLLSEILFCQPKMNKQKSDLALKKAASYIMRRMCQPVWFHIHQPEVVSLDDHGPVVGGFQAEYTGNNNTKGKADDGAAVPHSVELIKHTKKRLRSLISLRRVLLLAPSVTVWLGLSQQERGPRITKRNLVRFST